MTKRPAPKKLLFTFIIAMPALLLLFAGILLVRDLRSLQRTDPAVIFQDLKNFLPHKAFSSLPMPGELNFVDPARKKIFVFGASTLVISDGGLFTDYLGEIGKNLQVVNFGYSGIDSFLVRERVRETLAITRPDVIILLLGHNDFNSPYHKYIIPRYYDKFGWLLKIPYIFHTPRTPEGKKESLNFYWFKRLFRPRLYNALQSLGWFTFDTGEHENIRQLILEQYARNMNEIMDLAARQKIPVVFITPIGNLKAEPYGGIETTTELYRKGMHTEDYDQSIRYLKQARDSECFTYDLRAKSNLTEYLRRIDRNNVYLLDLEKILEQRHCEFGSDDFLDYFHLNDKNHRLLAQLIYDLLVRNNLAD